MSRFKKDIVCARCKGPIAWDRHKGEYCSQKCEKDAEGYQNLRSKTNKEYRDLVAATTAWKSAPLDPIQDITALKVGILSDIHCPIHSAAWLTQAIITMKHYGVEHVIINGDLIDANQISRHAGSYFKTTSLEHDLAAAEAVLELLSKNFKYLYLDAGNHDMRIIHRMGGEISHQRAMKMLGSFENLKVTARSFVRVNESVLVCHPRQYSRARGKLAQDLAIRHQAHVVTGHQHHSAKTISPDGRWQACDVGCLTDVELQDYVKNELTTHVEPVNGFAIIFGTKIEVYDKFTNWDGLGIEDVVTKQKKVKRG